MTFSRVVLPEPLGPRMATNSLSQVQADIIQCFLHQIAGFVFFLDVVELEHV